MRATASALIAYAIGLPAFVAQKLFQSVFYASNRPLVVLRLSFATVIANIIFSIIFMQILGHVGLALGTSVAIWLGVLFQAYLLLREKYLKINRFLKLFPIVVSCGVMGTVLKLLESGLMVIEILDIYILVILVSAGLVVYLGLASWIGFLPSGLLKNATNNRQK